jgi:nitroimidazol reductase NimA-like FMN-containing flavoprotein (pyridoxamine 5'-phosphate oxidase superfamily)
LRTLEREECLRLLQSVRYGTLATVDGDQPLVVVLNHLVDRDGIYLRTRTDARLARLTEGGRCRRPCSRSTARDRTTKWAGQ